MEQKNDNDQSAEGLFLKTSDRVVLNIRFSPTDLVNIDIIYHIPLFNHQTYFLLDVEIYHN